MITRRHLLGAAIPLPLTLLAGAGTLAPTPIPVDAAGLIGSVNAWRRHVPPATWDAQQATDALGWATECARTGPRHAFSADRTMIGLARWAAPLAGLQAPTPGARLIVGECIAAGQPNWGEAFNAWLGSPGHLGIIQHAPLVGVGMAGVELAGSAYRWYWVYRAIGWETT